MTRSAETIHGSCLCGGVTFEITSALLSMGNCHCSMCRRQHGTAFSTYAQVERLGLRITRGEELIDTFVSSDRAERQFCATCGSKLFYLAHNSPEIIWVAAGAFDDDPQMRCSYHIFTASKASWYEIADDLPQYAALPAGEAG